MIEKSFVSLLMAIAVLLFVKAEVACAEITRAKEMRDFFPYGVHIGRSNMPEARPIDEAELKAAIERVCKDLKEHNMNFAMIANSRVQDIDLWLEVAEKHGIRLLFQGGSFPFFHRPGEHAFRNKEVIKKFWEGMARKYKDNNTLLAWSLTEENPSSEKWAKMIAEIVESMAKIAPNHPAFVIDNRVTAAELNARIIKPRIFAAPKYPFSETDLWNLTTQAGARSFFEMGLTRYYQAARVADAVLWLFPQAMQCEARSGKALGLIPAWRYPTDAEMTWQIWKGISHGVKGFIHFTYAGYPKDPKAGGEHIEGLRDRNLNVTPSFRAAARMGKVVKLLSPLLLDLDVAPLSKDVIYIEKSAFVSGTTFVHRKTGSRYVIAVNNDVQNNQLIQFELGYWLGMLDRDDLLINVLTEREHDYYKIRLESLAPGEGAVFFVGTREEWNKETEILQWGNP